MRWTPLQQEVAGLARQGKGSIELRQLGYGKATVSRVLNALRKAGELVSPPSSPPASRHESTPPQKEEPSPNPDLQTRYRIGTSEPVSVGELQVMPEDWRISQHGIFLLLDTFYLSKEEVGYTGTMGQFLVDVFRFYRHLMQFASLPNVGPALPVQTIEEGSNNGRGKEISGGGGVHEKGGSADDEEAEREGPGGGR